MLGDNEELRALGSCSHLEGTETWHQELGKQSFPPQGHGMRGPELSPVAGSCTFLVFVGLDETKI